MLALLGQDNAGEAAPDMSTFQGVVTLFQDPTGVFGGWLHYMHCVCDPLVGRSRWMALDSVKRGTSWRFHVFAIVPTLVLALFVPPTAWFLYMMAVRPFSLPVDAELGKQKAKTK